MSGSKRTTIYFDPKLYRALKRKAAEYSQTISDFVNQAVRISLSEDAIDLEALVVRKWQSKRSFSSFARDLRKVGHRRDVYR
ncbi:MAG: CopG family transcriptional regulator [Desulfobacteraceae bacterium]|nr:CopG family transcriptional regulator [Desulfobacteraceae bacterium]